jgi:Leucine-rich repeat (LRR) protein
VWTFPTNVSVPCSHGWQGLGCTPSIERPGGCDIIEIWLNKRGLVGVVPPSIQYCQPLVYLSLSDNYLAGNINTEFGALLNLRAIYLNDNNYTGSLPSQLGQLAKVVDLDVTTNRLSQALPSELGLATNLQLLRLYFNHFSSSIPTEIANLKALVVFDAYSNYLTGPLPTELGRLTSLSSFNMYANHYSGPIPSQMGEMKSLELLDIQYSMLTGEIPSELWSLTELIEVNLGNNLMFGSLSSSIANCPSMGNFVLGPNYFTGTIATEIGQLVKLRQLNLQMNLFEGTIPTELALLTEVQVLFLAGNMLSRSIPVLSPSVVDLELSVNQLTGKVDSMFVNCSRLRVLDASNNYLVGSLPLAIQDCHILQSLSLASNMLSGPINLLGDNSSKKLQTLQSITLSDNSFSGTLSENLFLLPALQTIILYQNCFQGSLPNTVCEAKLLENIVLDSLTQNCGNAIPGSMRFLLGGYIPSHYMEGSIPSCIWNISGLTVFRALGNGFSGNLPDQIRSSQLSIAALGSNALTGSIPLSFQSRYFSQLDLSLNRLSGTLNDDLDASTKSTVYRMDVNRLSGRIPSSLYQSFASGVLNVLDGNLFSCPGDSLPSSDADHNAYECGSGSMEYSFIIWLICFCVFIVTVVGVVRCYADQEETARLIAEARKSSRFIELVVVTVGTLSIAVVVIALVGYLVFKLPPAWSSKYVTHSVQYWWTASAAFLHGWQVVLFLMLLLAATNAIIPPIVLYYGHDMIVRERSVSSSRDWRAALLWTVAKAVVHIVGFVIVLIVNAVYVVEAVAKISGVRLLLAQAALSLFKVVWSNTVSPWMIGLVTGDRMEKLPHLVVMSLFLFIGAPILATLLESSSCFHDLLASPATIESSFSVSALDCNSECYSTCTLNITGTCKTLCSDNCQFEPNGQVITVTSIQPWLYSYQCASSLVKNYSPVLIIGYLISGIFLPCIYLAYSALKIDWIAAAFPRVLRTTVLDKNLLCSDGDAAAGLFLKSQQTSRISKLGNSLMVRLVQNLTVLLTFGMASPLLAFAVAADGVIVTFVWFVLVERYVSLCKLAGLDGDRARNALMKSFQYGEGKILQCLLVMSLVSGIFWAFFIFDMIGDIYGAVVAGWCTLIPLLLPVTLCYFSIRCFHSFYSRELALFKGDDLVNPLLFPQSTKDVFGTDNDQLL